MTDSQLITLLLTMLGGMLALGLAFWKIAMNMQAHLLSRIDGLDRRMSSLESRVAHVEGLLEASGIMPTYKAKEAE